MDADGVENRAYTVPTAKLVFSQQNLCSPIRSGSVLSSRREKRKVEGRI